MREQIKKEIESITASSGHVVCPRKVVLIDSAGDMHAQPMRTVGLMQPLETECHVFINAADYQTRDAIQAAITNRIQDQFTVEDLGEWLMVSDKSKHLKGEE